MVKKDKKSSFKEKTLALKDAKSLTLEQLTEKTNALTTQNQDNESSLDKYIREHRAEIEFAKKDRLEKTIEAANSLDNFVKTVREDTTNAENADSEQLVSEKEQETALAQDLGDKETQIVVETSEIDNELCDDDAKLDLEDDEVSVISPISVQDSASTEDTTEFPEVQGSYDKVTLVDGETDREQESSDLQVVQDKHEAKTDLDNDAEKDFELVAEAPVVLSAKSGELDKKLADSSEDKTVENISVAIAENDSRSYKKPIIIGLFALVLLTTGGLLWHNNNQTKQKNAESAKASTQKKSEAAKQLSEFNQQYDAFFIDDEHTKLKNDQFAKISDLDSTLSKMTSHPDYKSLKTKVTALKTEITTIQNLNKQFNKAVVLDGALDKTAEVKDGVTLSYTATENATLNDLLKTAVAQGQSQQAKKTAEKAAAETAKQAAQSNANSQAATNSNNQANSASTNSSNPTGSGLSTAQFQSQNPAIAVETTKSRVPVDPNADLSSVAFAWSDGIKELVLGKCRQRGYISGDAYILLPASIQKGNGYYNLYKPDGTYLVSINCKTGYFVGNASGYADNLDY